MSPALDFLECQLNLLPMRQDFVDVVEQLEFEGHAVEASEPFGVAALLEELLLLDLDQVAALVAGRGHDGDVVAVVGRQRAVAAQDETLRAGEHLHVHRVVTHRLLDPIQLDGPLCVHCLCKHCGI